MQVITPNEVLSAIQQPATWFIDVREPAEFHAAHIAEAELTPLSKIAQCEVPETKQTVVVYCQKGVRAERAIKHLQSRYPQIEFFNVKHGIEGWQQAGLPIVIGESKGLSIDRQVQLTIGSAVLASTILASTVSLHWLWLTGLLGTGLILSGATGTCGLALLLARMPWNQN